MVKSFMRPAYFNLSYMYMYVQIYIMLSKCSDFKYPTCPQISFKCVSFFKIEIDCDFNQYVHVCNSYLVFKAYGHTLV